jgi:hypothetical protein
MRFDGRALERSSSGPAAARARTWRERLKDAKVRSSQRPTTCRIVPGPDPPSGYPATFHVLGTDGYGRSDLAPRRLRHFFESIIVTSWWHRSRRSPTTDSSTTRR